MNRFNENLSNSEKDDATNAAPILGALTTLSVGMTFLSETTQKNLELYWKIHESLGEGFANVVLGQFGDIGAPIAVGSFLGLLVLIINKDEKHSNEDSFVAFKALMEFASIVCLINEFSTLFSSYKLDCGEPGGHCTGELTDLLAFSIPLITSLIFLLGRQIRNH